MPRSEKVSREALKRIECPKGMGAFHPIPHHEVLDVAEEVFEKFGLKVAEVAEEEKAEERKEKEKAEERKEKEKAETISLANGGLLMACQWRLDTTKFEIDPNYIPLAVLFNGNDKHHALRVGFGTVVWVCKNGMVSAENMVRQVHLTPDWKKTLRVGLSAELTQFTQQGNWYQDLLTLLRALKGCPTSQTQVNNILIESMERSVIPSSHIKKALDIYRRPRHSEYDQGTLYTLHSAITEVVRDADPLHMPRKTMTLNGIMSRELTAKYIGTCPLLSVLSATPNIELRITNAPPPQRELGGAQGANQIGT